MQNLRTRSTLLTVGNLSSQYRDTINTLTITSFLKRVRNQGPGLMLHSMTIHNPLDSLQQPQHNMT